MANAWTDALRLATIHKAAEPKPVTIVLPFYQAHEFLNTQVETWCQYPEEIRRHLSAIIVDDGSPVPAPVIRVQPFPIRQFRIDVDVPWNWLAARNIGAHYAEQGWLLLTDMDHVVPTKTAESLVMDKHDPNFVYALSRREHTGVAIRPHSASFFMTRRMFWNIGGYDERLAGVYGTDGVYRKRAMSVAPFKLLEQELIRYEYVGDSSVTTYERKTEAMRQKRRQKFATVPQGSRPKVLSYPYHEVAL